MIVRRLLSIAAIVSICAIAAADVQAQGKRPSDPEQPRDRKDERKTEEQKKEEPRKEEQRKAEQQKADQQKAEKQKAEQITKAPLLFYVATGEDGACGDGCNEWIAAEGYFDPGSSARLRAFLKRQSARKRPIFFQSPGGIQAQALAIGRRLRERAMTAAVAITVPASCRPGAENDDACRAVKRSGQPIAAELRPMDSSCNSACVYALIGAAVRQVPPGARLGVHSGKLIRVYTDGRVNLSPKNSTAAAEKPRMAELENQLRRYVREMGIDAGLLDAAFKVPYEQVRYLSRDEIARFGIDSRAFQEIRWTITHVAAKPPAVFKLVAEAKGADGKEYRISVIRLSCTGADRFAVSYMRGLASGETGAWIVPRIAVAERAIEFRRAGFVSKIDALDTGGSFAMWVADAPLELLQAAALADSIDIVESDRLKPTRATRVLKLSTAGLHGAFDTLRQSCANPS